MNKMSRKQFVAGMAATAASPILGNTLTGAGHKASEKIKVCVFSNRMAGKARSSRNWHGRLSSLFQTG